MSSTHRLLSSDRQSHLRPSQPSPMCFDTETDLEPGTHATQGSRTPLTRGLRTTEAQITEERQSFRNVEKPKRFVNEWDSDYTSQHSEIPDFCIRGMENEPMDKRQKYSDLYKVGPNESIIFTGMFKFVQTD